MTRDQLTRAALAVQAVGAVFVGLHAIAHTKAAGVMLAAAAWCTAIHALAGTQASDDHSPRGRACRHRRPDPGTVTTVSASTKDGGSVCAAEKGL